MHGGDGNDLLIGGTDNDSMTGGPGNDLLQGQDGDDLLRGGADDDTLEGDAGADELRGDGENDLLKGGAGDDILRGGELNDTLLAGTGDDTLDGGAGDDRLYGGDGADTIDGGDGNDRLYGEDVLLGGTGADTLRGETGDDVLRGHGGPDIVIGGSGADRLDGDDAADQLFGDEGADTIGGGGDGDTMQGGIGDDLMHGGGGNDTVLGDDGNDRLLGGAGDDSLEGSLGNDTIQGGDGDDVLRGEDDDDELVGEAGNDFLSGGMGADQLDGGDDDDSARGGAGNDTLTGGAGSDTLVGDDDDDLLVGNDGADFLDGRWGSDTIQGGAGNDILLGGFGNDSLSAGNDRDVVIGGRGSDTLNGNNDDDILIGSATVYDNSVAGLTAVLAAWTDTFDYDTRVAMLEDENFAQTLQSELTVFDDSLSDWLTGAAGQDWFFEPGEDGSASRDFSLDVVEGGTSPEQTNNAGGDSSGFDDLFLPDALAKPDYLVPFTDPTYGSMITRITADVSVTFETVENTGGTTTREWSELIKNRYVTETPWSRDGSLIQLRSFAPSLPYQLVLNNSTLAPEFIANIPTTSFRWSQDPARPTTQYGLIQNGVDDHLVVEYELTTGVVARQIELPFNKLVSGKETVAFVGGRNYVAMLGVPRNPIDTETATDISIHVVDLDYDAATESPVVASLVLTGTGCGHYDDILCDSLNINSMRFAPDGSRVLVQYYGATLQSPTWRLLDVDLAAGTISSHVLPTAAEAQFGNPLLGHFPVRWGHPVFALGSNGVDVHVIGSSGNWRGSVIPEVTTHDPGGRVGGVLSFNSQTNVFTSLTTPTDEATVSHVNATNYANPGYIFVSYEAKLSVGSKYRGEIIAIKLDDPSSGDAVTRLAHHRTNALEECYSCQAHLAASPQGDRLLFSTTWGLSQSVVSSYLLDLDLPAL
jgi:Ca2+-binding RTX toxin-like protein